MTTNYKVLNAEGTSGAAEREWQAEQLRWYLDGGAS